MVEDGQGALSLFHPVVRSWFRGPWAGPPRCRSRRGRPSPRGEHVLVSAPTGTGKTLAAFLWGIDRLVAGRLPAGAVRILYVSPLKALNNDIRRNLLAPLGQLREAFQAAGEPFPALRVRDAQRRHPAAERRRMLTPSAGDPHHHAREPEPPARRPRGPAHARRPGHVILDEIHAVAGTKRGTHLVTAVERLVALAGRVPAHRALGDGAAAVRRGRPGRGLADRRPGKGRRFRLVREARRADRPRAACQGVRDRVCSPRPPRRRAPPDLGPAQPSPAPSTRVWGAVAARCRAIAGDSGPRCSSSTPAGTRRSWPGSSTRRPGATLAWAHHGSLSREMRLVVEQRLKRGELRAIVATSSLELGIDIGALDEVVLVESPFTVASAVQRLGRAGHGVGEASRAVLLPLHGRDLLDAAVTARAVRLQDIESVTPVVLPAGRAGAGDRLHDQRGDVDGRDRSTTRCARAAPYHELPRRQFDLVLDMLAGRYAETRLRELAPMVSLDLVTGTVRAREGARCACARTAGPSPTGGTSACARPTRRRCWASWTRSSSGNGRSATPSCSARRPGGSSRIGHQDVEVVPAPTRSAMSPFWKAEERNGDFHVSLLVSPHPGGVRPAGRHPGVRGRPGCKPRDGGGGGAHPRRVPGEAEARDRGRPAAPAPPPGRASPRGSRAGREIGGFPRGPAHPVGRPGQQAVQPGPCRGVARTLRRAARALPGRRRDPPGARAGAHGPGDPRPGAAREPRAPAAPQPGGKRVLRRALPRERRACAAAAPLLAPSAHAAVADPAAGEDAAVRRVAVRRLPADP